MDWMSDIQALVKPPIKLDVDTWADRYRKLSPEASSEVGQWKTDRFPPQRGMMRAVTEPGVKKVVFMTSAQSGKTEALLNILGYFMSMDPGPIILFQPSQFMAESFSKDRLSPMLRDTPILQGLVQDSKMRGQHSNTLLHKSFKGGHLTMAGIQSASALASRPIRTLLIDEVDRAPISAYVGGAQKEGDPVSLAEMRTANFSNSLVVLASTPTKKNSSRIESAYLASDQRKFFIACPHCGRSQTLKFSQLKWHNHDPNTTRYECEGCHQVIDERLKHELLFKGDWKSGAPFLGTAGFWISSLYSPWTKWKEITTRFLTEKISAERLQTFVNCTLGETWEEKGESPDWRRLYDRREHYEVNTIPPGVLFLTMGVDVQQESLQAEIVGWCEDKSSFSINCRVIVGSTSTSEPWAKLDELIATTWTLANGITMSISMTAIDSGFNTNYVYGYVRSKPMGKVMAVKGMATTHYALGHPTPVDVNQRGRRIQRGTKVWPVGVNVLKSELYGWLNLDSPVDQEPYPRGFCHFPHYDAEFFQQLTAEHMITRKVKGYAKISWEKIRPDNHALDCRVYARAAASAVGIDRMTEKEWGRLKQELGLTSVEPQQTEQAPVFSF